MLVLQAQARLDILGVVAALGGAAAMSSDVVLTRKWGRPDTLLATTSWQLIVGGLFLAPIAVLIEGPPPLDLTLPNVFGYLYLGIIGTSLAPTRSGSGACTSCLRRPPHFWVCSVRSWQR